MIYSETKNIPFIPSVFFRKMTAGEFGCFCSHRSVWKEIVKKAYPNTLILEDDTQARNNLRSTLPLVTDHLPKGYDVLYLYYWLPDPDFYQKKKIKRIINNYYINKITSENCSIWAMASYLMSYKAAVRLLEYSKHFHGPMDDFLSFLLTRKK